ncbi:MAG: hypothetical protein HY918_01835 [Candidatus Doudnabacteria bacterium]|nr:hypothetical protein [Candidatus Doudnabacteria bacterium]
MNISKKTAVLFSILGLAAGTAGTVALQTKADNSSTTNDNSQNGMRQFVKPAAAGQVTAISGSTLTVTDSRTNTSFTVDASAAALEKFESSSISTGKLTPPTPTTITIADIKVGDHVMVQGTVSGNNIVATKITDGQMGKGFGRGQMHGAMGTVGTVSSVSGNTITLTGKDGATYTVEASAAAVNKISTISVSDIAVGDTLMVAGEKNGSQITAKHIMDGQMPQIGKVQN